jgi:hypothetical protein
MAMSHEPPLDMNVIDAVTLRAHGLAYRGGDGSDRQLLPNQLTVSRFIDPDSMEERYGVESVYPESSGAGVGEFLNRPTKTTYLINPNTGRTEIENTTARYNLKGKKINDVKAQRVSESLPQEITKEVDHIVVQGKVTNKRESSQGQDARGRRLRVIGRIASKQ